MLEERIEPIAVRRYKCHSAGRREKRVGIVLGRDGTTGTPPPQPAPIAPSHAPAQASPSIVFILTDDLANNLVQFMPHVLAMQKNGITFTNYFVTDSLCCPSRSSIFTGRYPHDTGVFTNAGADGGYGAFTARGNDQSGFAVALARAGYRTAFLGKYLNGYQPNQHAGGPGWHHWVVAGNGYLEFNYTFNRDGTLVPHDNKPEDYLTDVVAFPWDRLLTDNEVLVARLKGVKVLDGENAILLSLEVSDAVYQNRRLHAVSV